MRCKVSEAFIQGVKAGFGTKERKPGSPDVGRDEKRPVGHFDYDLEQIPRIQTQNGPPVRSEVSDSTKSLIQPDYGIHIRHEDQMVQFPCPSIPLVDTAYLSRK